MDKRRAIVVSLLLAGGLLAAGAGRSQEPPPFPGHDDAQAPDQAGDQSAAEGAANDPAVESADTFHQELAPYGQWTPHDGGEVWVPRVEPGWRPYTSGHWVSTDQGWAWVANEPWGWGPFHYGRWAYDSSLGWAWTPGYVWAPAWVSWRHGGGYLGWAPLPPTIGFRAEVGLDPVGGYITPGYYTFVSERNILSVNVFDVILPSRRNVLIVRGAPDITRYDVVGGRIYDRGVDVRRIEQVIGHPVSRLRVADMVSRGGPGGRGAFYQPAVIARAAHLNHAEFGAASRFPVGVGRARHDAVHIAGHSTGHSVGQEAVHEVGSTRSNNATHQPHPAYEAGAAGHTHTTSSTEAGAAGHIHTTSGEGGATGHTHTTSTGSGQHVQTGSTGGPPKVGTQAEEQKARVDREKPKEHKPPA